MTPLFLVVGLSGSGKSTLVRQQLDGNPELAQIPSQVTRPRRPSDDGDPSLHFITPQQFEAHMLGDEFIEHERFGVNSYGTLSRDLELKHGERGLVKICRPAGAIKIAKACADTHAIMTYIVHSPVSVCATRLTLRDGINKATSDRIAGLEREAVELYDAWATLGALTALNVLDTAG